MIKKETIEKVIDTARIEEVVECLADLKFRTSCYKPWAMRE